MDSLTTTGHVFISYAREDQAYARELADNLRERGFEPWMDDRIDFGDRWWQTIVQAICASSAFVVVMTPDAEQSEWVERELLLAQRVRKPIFPLLLRGQGFSLLITTQYADVTHGQMPPDAFYERLARVALPKLQTEVAEGDFELQVYLELVNLATEALMLSKWDLLGDLAVRLQLHDKFVEGVNTFWYAVQKTIWPRRYPELESSIINLSDRLDAYVKHFLSNSRLRGNNLHVEDQTWRQQPIDLDYRFELQKKSDEWQDTSTKLLLNVVVALNEFADSVRKYLNPSYLVFQGRFIIHDSFGVLSGGEPSIRKPEEYFEI